MLKDHKALELDKILLQLANETTCPDAAELAQKIEPDTVCCRDIACHPQCFGLA